MDAIVLAGGFGTRLRSILGNSVPKPMALINGRPFLELLLENLRVHGIAHVILSVGYCADQISNHFGSSWHGIDIEYSFESEPLGTGGGVRKALSLCNGESVLVLNGDTFLDVDYRALEDEWLTYRRPIIVSRWVADVSRYGSLIIENDLVVGFAEKGCAGEGVISAGVYVLPRNALDDYVLNSPFSLELDFFGRNLNKLKVRQFRAEGRFIDIGTPDDYYKSQALLRSN